MSRLAMAWHRVLCCGCWLLGALLAPTAAAGDDLWTSDYAAAVAQAEAEGKPLLLEFTGSDWCAPCKVLEQKVFATETFRTEAPKSYVLVQLDYPMRTELPPGVKQQNAELRERYPVPGLPTVLLTDVQGRVFYARSGYFGQTPEQYLTELAVSSADRDILFEALAQAEGLEGLARAEALHRGLSALGQEAALLYYNAEVRRMLDDAEAAGNLEFHGWRSARNNKRMAHQLNGLMRRAESMQQANRADRCPTGRVQTDRRAAAAGADDEVQHRACRGTPGRSPRSAPASTSRCARQRHRPHGRRHLGA